jgi:D-3-phosphoglycerate dehydrogenase
MKKFKVYVTEPIPELDAGLGILRDIAEIKLNDRFIGKVLAKDIKDADAIIAGDSKITRESLKEAKKLKVIGRFGAGLDSVDINACTEKDILLFNVPGMNAESVAEHIIGMMIALSKKFRLHDKLVRDGKWVEKSKFMGNELWRKTIGIVGLGNIGYLLAKMVKAFEMRVLTYDPFVSQKRAKEVGAEIVDLQTLLKKSDYVSINCPLVKETRGMIGEEELRLMKKSAFLINTARGGIVKEDSLYKALKGGWIEGAGVDALENEPVTKHPIFELDNILLTPHFASWTVEAFRRVAIKACENVRKALKGDIPDNLVNKEVIAKIKHK